VQNRTLVVPARPDDSFGWSSAGPFWDAMPDLAGTRMAGSARSCVAGAAWTRRASMVIASATHPGVVDVIVERGREGDEAEHAIEVGEEG
jgi:hypothetical protein